MKYLNHLIFSFILTVGFVTHGEARTSPSPAKKPVVMTLGILDNVDEAERNNKYVDWKKDGASLERSKFCKSIVEENLDSTKLSGDGAFEIPIKDDPFLLYVAYNPVWNSDPSKNDTATTGLEAFARKVLENGHSIVFSAGGTENGEPKMIPRTLAGKLMEKNVEGQVAQTIVVGELTERERLVDHSNFGPEIFTSVKPPKELMGKNIGPYIFAHDLACALQLNSRLDIVFDKLKSRKDRSKKIWIPVEELFAL